MIQTQQPNIAPFHSASLYVGDLPKEVSETVLFDLFNNVGPVASIRVCRDAVTRSSLGYAYVNFHTVGDAERAIDTMNYSLINAKQCRIMWSQRDPSLRRSNVGNVFIKNLDASINHKELYDTFSLFGNILSCKVAVDAEGKSKGYGYVHYETAESATEAINKLNNSDLAGKIIAVVEFVGRSKRPSQNDWTNCYIKNIPLNWNEQDLMANFGKCGHITSAVIMKNSGGSDDKGEFGSSKGFGFVNFSAHEEAMNAVNAFNGQPSGEINENGSDKVFYVAKAQKKDERVRELKFQNEQNKLERSSKFQGTNVYVKNFDNDMTDESLRKIFSVYGKIESCKVMKDSTENPINKGFGFVCFSNPEDAEKAIQMNGQMINGRPIYIALAQRKEQRRFQLEQQFAQKQFNYMRGAQMGLQPPMGPMYMPPMYGGVMPIGRQPYGMMPMMRGMPTQNQRGAAPVQQFRGNYQMPMYANVGNQQQPPQQQQQQFQQNQQNQRPRTQQTARQRPPQTNSPQQAPRRAQQQQQTVKAEQALTVAMLAAASPENQKNMIGERLYPLIYVINSDLAGKITGMLLEMDNSELLHLLESPESLHAKISEAIHVLETHGVVSGN